MMDYTLEQSQLLAKFVKLETKLKEATASVDNLRDEYSELQSEGIGMFGINFKHEVNNAKRYMSAFPEVFGDQSR